MAIYDLSDMKQNPYQQELPLEYPESKGNPEQGDAISSKVSFFSSFAARLFFFILLIADIAWGVYSLALCLFSLVLNSLTFFQLSKLKKMGRSQFSSLKRSAICGISLLIAIFSPSLGIMIASTYFIMYDKAGIDEVVPSSLQAQFREFLS